VEAGDRARKWEKLSKEIDEDEKVFEVW